MFNVSVKLAPMGLDPVGHLTRGSRSTCDAGEGRAASKTLTRLAALNDLGPLFAAQARAERERYTCFQSA